MREGKPSKRFGHLGLHNVNLGGAGSPVLIKLYGTEDQVIATLTEEQGACIDPGHLDFFEGPNCRPARYASCLVEILADGTKHIVHDNPKFLAADPEAWIEFLGDWVYRLQHQPT